ncbi:MAG: molybdate ABC transporter substrate-binding protein [Desulfovibrionaceae bacterium CG1_02_65_16]|nr:MAG: molybdate ABC transporter substrate-binding protein [Desulfovibrionaceae bacterium CG1_02_65_16]
MRKRFSALPAIVLAVALCLAPGMASAADLTVSAAASLTDAFKALKVAFEKANPGTTITTNFAASGALLRQLENGAPVDVFASADQKTMNQAAEKKLIVPATRVDFVQNSIVLVQPADSKINVKSMADLAKPDVKRVAIGNPATVPAGRYSTEGIALAHLTQALAPKLVPAESVRQTLDYVTRGEVDAGFVFATDAKHAAAKVRFVQDVPTTTKVTYPIAVIASSKNPQAKAFIAFVVSPEGQKILGAYGFKKP